VHIFRLYRPFNNCHHHHHHTTTNNDDDNNNNDVDYDDNDDDLSNTAIFEGLFNDRIFHKYSRIEDIIQIRC